MGELGDLSSPFGRVDLVIKTLINQANLMLDLNKIKRSCSAFVNSRECKSAVVDQFNKVEDI